MEFVVYCLLPGAMYWTYVSAWQDISQARQAINRYCRSARYVSFPENTRFEFVLFGSDQPYAISESEFLKLI
jgi:hypothetical protein